MQTPEETDEEGFTFKRRKRAPDAMAYAAQPAAFSSSLIDHTVSSQSMQSFQKQQLSTIQQFSPASPISPTSSRLKPLPHSIPSGRLSLDYYTPLAEKPHYATFETDSLYLADEDSDNGEGWQMRAHPPSDVPESDYYKHIKMDMPDALRMKQVLLWGVHRLLDAEKDEPDAGKDKTTLKAERIALRIKTRLLQKLEEGAIDTSWYRRPLITDYTPGERKPHPRNVRNEKSIRDHEARIEVFKDELELWKKASFKIYESHAATIDNYATSTGEIRVAYSDAYLDLLDSDQQAFLRTCGGRRAKLDIDKTISGMDCGINAIRQSLNSADQFQQLAGLYAKGLMADVTRRRYRSTRCLPADESVSVVDQENKDQLLQDRDNRRLVDVLRLLSRCQ